jgi:hypothetical protein
VTPTGRFFHLAAACSVVPQENPVPAAVADHWTELLDDARATAAEYRDRGWEVLLVHTADATVVEDGLDVLVPDNEYEELTTLTAAATFDSVSVYANTAGGVTFLLIVAEATEQDEAVAIPAYFPVADEPQLREQAETAGVLTTRLRALGAEPEVTLTHEEPALFFSG